jgi:hypothetical protein
VVAGLLLAAPEWRTDLIGIIMAGALIAWLAWKGRRKEIFPSPLKRGERWEEK